LPSPTWRMPGSVKMLMVAVWFSFLEIVLTKEE
jgi:hypothetical protein